MTDFVLCASCARHLKPDAERCPFCDAPRVPSLEEAAPKAAVPKGQSRAKLYALQAAALATGVTTAACGGTTAVLLGDASGDDGSGDAPAETATDDATSDTGTDTTGTPDAPEEGTNDSGPGRDGFCCPPYGCAFPKTCDKKVTV